MSFQAMAWAVGHELPLAQKMVLLMLANRTNTDTGRCNPTLKLLAKDCGMSTSSVKRAIGQLLEGGFMTLVSAKVGMVNLPNQYNLCLDKGVGSQGTQGVQADKGRSTQNPPRASVDGGVGSDRPEGWVHTDPLNSNLKLEDKQEVKPNCDPASPGHVEGQLIEAGKSEGANSRRPADMPGPKDPGAKTYRPWVAYAHRYKQRYGVYPVWNAKVGGQFGQLVAQLGDEATSVAEFYLKLNSRYYVEKLHSVDLLLKDCASIRTQWATGTTVTAAQAQQIDKTQTNANAVDEALAISAQRRASRGET